MAELAFAELAAAERVDAPQSLATILAVYLAEAGARPLAYGKHDCGLWLCDWVMLRRPGFVDPGAAFRGRYQSEAGCARILKRGGGLLKLFTAAFEAAGLEPTRTPCAGDIGVVMAKTERAMEAVGAICTGPRWACLARGGLMGIRTEHLAAWRV